MLFLKRLGYAQVLDWLGVEGGECPGNSKLPYVIGANDGDS